MGRPEKPLPSNQYNIALLRLAAWLRECRKEAGLRYSDLAARTRGTEHPCSVSTLQRAASGQTLPRLPVVEAYARACGASVDQAHRHWRAARAQSRRGPQVAPVPRLINMPAELRLALQAAYAKAGYMPLREMERRAGHGRLPTTTVSRMLKGITMLSRNQLQAFLEVCNVPDKEHGDWLDAWQRAQSARYHRATRELVAAAHPQRRVIEYDRHSTYGTLPARSWSEHRPARLYQGYNHEEAAVHEGLGDSDPLRRSLGLATTSR
ncbi:helix-turn-helix transcriptional regulator [Streptomyces longwoodensis]|uniref:helix-turn-helix domain-containing protein n=1 Tax=Streptomyces longwoodensis TaxID=68231 RepID=UPI002E808902|nr:helix-turn-helix transcriptional regulator [Streptomyces longwoodensis]WUC55730.1 helix-turn-helix transcriptional regulator [Streptomyces longwoodensis]WUC62151.1 helix-turn-helix transcriptional regulator [Streptomyces longwoodensis]